MTAEVSLSTLLKNCTPNPLRSRRRVDLLVFSPQTQRPLLVIECKAHSLKTTSAHKAVRQLLGYNFFLQCPYIALAHGRELLLWHEGEISEQIPPYREIYHGEKNRATS